MKNRFLLLLIISFIYKFTYSQNIDCSEAFELALKTDLKIKDQGSFDKSFLSRIESEEFREYLNKEYQKRISGGGTKGGGVKVFGLKLIDLPEIDLDNNKEISKTEHRKFVSKWKRKISQNNKRKWLKEFAISYLPNNLSSKIISSWDNCNKGIIELEKHKINIDLEIKKLSTVVTMNSSDNNALVTLKETYRKGKLDEYEYLIRIRELINEDKASERDYKLEKYRIEAKRRGLNYNFDINNNEVIDIFLEYSKPYKTSPNEITITGVFIRGGNFDKKLLYEGMTFSTKKIIPIYLNDDSKKIDILIETDIEAPIRFYKNFSLETYRSKIKFNDGQYVGQIKLGKPDGIGVFYSKNYIYDGKWKEGELIRAEVKNMSGRLIYSGKLKDYKPSGMGSFYYLSKKGASAEFIGNFRRGMYFRGVVNFKNGKKWIRYIGSRKNLSITKNDYWNDLYFSAHGRGELIGVKGRKSFKGKFKEGNFESGKYTYSDGDYFKGQWRDGKKYKGKLYRLVRFLGLERHTLEYEGTFKDGEYYNGIGTSLGGVKYIFENGEKKRLEED